MGLHQCDLVRMATILFLGGMNDVCTCEIFLKCIDFFKQSVIRASHMDWVLTAFLQNRNVYCCATVIEGEGMGIESTQLEDIV